jgi:hypothetical protein
MNTGHCVSVLRLLQSSPVEGGYTIYNTLAFSRSILKLKLIYDRRSVGQFVLVSGSRLEPMTRFFPLSDDGRVLNVEHPLR